MLINSVTPIHMENGARSIPSKYRYGKCSKIWNTYLVLFSNKMLVIKVGIHKMLVREQTEKTLIRLLLPDQTASEAV